MRVDELKLKPEFIEIIKNWGIEELYPPQEEAVKKIMDGDNVIVSIPTASGKTLIGYIAMMYALQYDMKVAYIVPYKALAEEKYDELKVLEDYGYKVQIGTSDYEHVSHRLKIADVKILTSEKADAMLRNYVQMADELGVVVVDEIHLLGDESRGATLEFFLTKLLNLNPAIQIVGLSATIGNVEDIAKWLDAHVVKSEFRVVPLYVGAYDLNYLYINDEKIKIERGPREIEGLIDWVLKKNKQALVFVSTRKEAESMANALSKITNSYMDFISVSNVSMGMKELIQTKEKTPMMEKEIDLMRKGIAFHHAGLDSLTRRVVENMFRSGNIKIVCSTSTLAAGVNLPAYAVVIKTMHKVKSEDSRFITVPLRVIDIMQMLGRAGRPKYDKEGLGICVVDSRQDYQTYMKVINQEYERITSQITNESKVRKEMIGLIAKNMIITRDDLEYYMRKTFYYSLFNSISDIMGVCDDAIKIMQGMGIMQYIHGKYFTGDLGEWIAKTYLDPMSAYYLLSIIFDAGFTDDFSILFGIGVAPDMPFMPFRANIDELVHTAEENRWDSIYAKMIMSYDRYMSGIKIASILYEWINEVPLDEIELKWHVQDGDIYALVSNATWIISSIKIICENVDRYRRKDILEHLNRLYIRVKYGVREEIADLVAIRYVGRRRARELYEHGFKSVEEVANANVKDLTEIKGIGEKLAEKIIKNAKAVISIRKEI